MAIVLSFMIISICLGVIGMLGAYEAFKQRKHALMFSSIIVLFGAIFVALAALYIYFR
jgi:hypothetical protein